MKRLMVASALWSAGVLGQTAFASYSGQYILADTALNPPYSWNLTSAIWGDNQNSNAPLTTWPPGINLSARAIFMNQVTLPNGSNGTITPGPVYVNGPITVNEVQLGSPGFSLAAGTGTLTMVGSIPGIVASSSATVSVPLQGTNGMMLASGPGATLTLSGVSTYSGPTTISAGTVSLSVNNALPFTDAEIESTLALNGSNESLGNVSIDASGTLTTNGGNLTASSLTNNGTASASSTSSTIANGALTIGDLGGNGTISLTGTFLTAGVNSTVIDTYYGNLTGNGSFFKTGSSQLILLGNTSLTGAISAPDITVQGGTLAGNTHNLVGSIYVVSGATLEFAQPANGTFSGALAGSGNVLAGGLAAGTVLTFTQLSTFNGSLAIENSLILAISSDGQLGENMIVQNGQKSISYATVSFDGGTLRTTAALTSARSYTVTQNGGTLDTYGFASTFSGTFSSTGNGTLTITDAGSATFSNSVGLNTLAVSQATAAFANSCTTVSVPLTLASPGTGLAVASGVVSLSGYAATATGGISLTGNSTLTLTRSTLQSGSVSIGTGSGDASSAAFTGLSGSWSISGTLTLGKDAVYMKPLSSPAGIGALLVPTFTTVSVTGTTTLLANSTLTVHGTFSTGALASSSSSTPVISITTLPSFPVIPEFFMGGSGAANGTYNGSITDGGSPGSIEKVGTNTQTLAGTDSYSGETLIGGGTLVIASNSALPAASLVVNNAGLTIAAASVTANIISGNGTLSISAGDRLTLAGAGASEQSGLTLNSNSILDIGSDGFILEATASTKSFYLSQAMTDVLSGRLGGGGIVSNKVSSTPSQFAIAVVDNAVLGDSTFQGQPVDGNSVIVAPALLGDTDLSGTVDLTDLRTVLKELGTATSAWTSGNFDGNSTIDLSDLNDVLNNLGASYATGSSGIPTPEPSTAPLAALALAFLIRRREVRRLPGRGSV